MTSDESTYLGEEGEDAEEVLGPDSLRALKPQLGWSDTPAKIDAHADAWEAERKDNAALGEALADERNCIQAIVKAAGFSGDGDVDIVGHVAALREGLERAMALLKQTDAHMRESREAARLSSEVRAFFASHPPESET